MAASKSNSSVKNKQLALSRPGSSILSPRRAGIFDNQHSARAKAKVWSRRLIHYPESKGKTIESVEFSTELGYHSISVNFTDKTSLNFAIDASFTVETDYSNWKSGNQRIIRRWRPVQNLEFRDTL